MRKHPVMIGKQHTTERLRERLAQIDAPHGRTRSVFTHVVEGAALAEAEASDARAACGSGLGALDGLIISIKDLFDVKGEVTLAGGLPAPEGKAAIEDAAVVSALRAEGAVILGKTNMTEFAFSGLGLNPHYGTPANALDPLRIPGGSSSGAAISVALDLADIAIGSDTGGSVRIPAALNGLVGFKPGQARISRKGVFPLSYTLDCVGFIAKDLPVIAAVYDALAVDEEEVLSAPSHIRCGVPRGFLFGDTDDHVSAAFEAALHDLQALGHAVGDVELDDLLHMPFRLQTKGTVIGAEAAYIHGDRMGEPSLFDPFVFSRLQKGQMLDAATYVGILQKRAELLPQLDAALSDLDVLILPTVPIVAPLLSELEDPAALDRSNALLLRNTSVFNFFDLPAISLPVRTGDPTRAVGCMIVGKRGADRLLLSIAAKFLTQTGCLAR